MKLKLFFLLTAIFILSSACVSGNAASENESEVVFNDGYKASAETGGEIVIDDRALQTVNGQILTTTESSEEIVQTLEDNSQVTVRYDGYGNKTETRNFTNHPRVTTLLIRTGANGEKQIYVYGYGKDVKSLPGEMTDRALSASADEIANAAGLYETRSNEELTNFRKSSKPLQPLPSSNFPIQMPPQITVQSQPQLTETVPAAAPETAKSADEETKAPVAETQEPPENQ